MQDKVFLAKLRRRQLEVSSIPPQNLGVFNDSYHGFSSYFKVAPWKILIPLSILAVIVLKLLTGYSIVNIVSILQEGF